MMKSFSLLLLLLACPPPTRAELAPPRVPYTATQYLKNFALSNCLAQGLPTPEAQTEAKDAAGGYLELGSLGMEAHEEAAALASSFLAKPYQGKHGGKLTVMKCIDLFHSRELDQLVKKYGRQRQAGLKAGKE